MFGDFGWRENWVKAKGYYLSYYESRRVQTIQSKMGIDVTGWYDQPTRIATETLQKMYRVNNASGSVFGRNTCSAMDSLSNSPDRFWKYHEFSQQYKSNLAYARLGDFAADLLVNAAIFGFGKAALSKLLPEATITFNPLNAGPLSQDVALTFRSATYTERTLNKATTFYRVIGKNGNPTGNFWTTTKPTGSVQSMLDSAILPEWGNLATNVVRITVPVGTRVYQGIAGPQGGLLGGGIQVYIPQVNPRWIQSIGPMGGM